MGEDRGRVAACAFDARPAANPYTRWAESDAYPFKGAPLGADGLVGPPFQAIRKPGLAQALACMKHACADTLRRIDDLLGPLRELGVFREPRPGCFYLKARAFLHFHEDASGLFADVRLDQREFSRFAVNTPDQRQQLFQTIRHRVAGWK